MYFGKPKSRPPNSYNALKVLSLYMHENTINGNNNSSNNNNNNNNNNKNDKNTINNNEDNINN